MACHRTGVKPLSEPALQWRHNERDCVSNHRRLDCLLNRLFKCRSKKTSKRTPPTPITPVTGLCEGNSQVNSLHKGPVTRKMFPFDDVIICWPILHRYDNSRPFFFSKWMSSILYTYIDCWYSQRLSWQFLGGLWQKEHDAPVTYRIRHHFETEICTSTCAVAYNSVSLSSLTRNINFHGCLFQPQPPLRDHLASKTTSGGGLIKEVPLYLFSPGELAHTSDLRPIQSCCFKLLPQLCCKYGTSYQIRKTACCACTGNVFPHHRGLAIPACIAARAQFYVSGKRSMAPQFIHQV